MKNKTVKMISAVVVLVAICGAYAGVKTYVAKQEETENEEENTTTNVFTASADDIKSIKFVIDKKEVTFEKTNDSWVKQDEKDFPVNQTTLNEAQTAIETVDASRVLEKVDNLSQYGLDDPSNTIGINTNDTTTVLRIGEKNGSTSQYYISKDDDRNTVYLVDALTVDPFMNTLYDYAQMGEFPTITDSVNISKVQVDQGETSYALEKNAETGLWDVTNGDSIDKADSAAVTSLNSTISSMAYGNFIDYNCSDKGKYGLDKPYATVTVDYQEETTAENDTDTAETSSDAETDTTEASDTNAEENVENSPDSDEADNASVSDFDITTDSEDDSSTDTTDEDTEETVMEDKQLRILIGDEAEDSSRYVMVNDSSEVYTISDDTLTAIIDKSASDFWDLAVNSLSINNLGSLVVNYNDKEHTINVSRETSQNEDGEDEVTTIYQLDGKDITDSTMFTIFYNKLINIAGQTRLTEEYDSADEPEFMVTFNDVEGNKTKVDYYYYDTNFYAAVIGTKVYLVNKMTVKDLISSYESLTGELSDEDDMTDVTETADEEKTSNTAETADKVKLTENTKTTDVVEIPDSTDAAKENEITTE